MQTETSIQALSVHETSAPEPPPTEGPAVTPSILHEYLTPAQLCEELHVCDKTLRRWHVQRTGPPRVQIGRLILYRREAVREWLRSREIGPVRRSK